MLLAKQALALPDARGILSSFMATKNNAASRTSSNLTTLLLLIIALLLGVILIGSGFFFGTGYKQVAVLTPTVFPPATAAATAVPTASQISPAMSTTFISSGPNPASAFCTQQGGTLSLQTRGDGGQYGLCTFEDNSACEEWAMFRSECPIGGVKTTGFDTIQQKYCAWSGGSTLAVEDATCTFSNGVTCDDLAFYNGTCPKDDS